jgi:hypothetical protein
VIVLARILGVLTQGLVLGVLLSLAIAELLALATGGRVFRYEGF